MAKRHKRKWIDVVPEDLERLVDLESHKGHKKHGNFASWHEMYAVCLEELEEFWDGVKANDPDPYELLQLSAVARQAFLQLCQEAQMETE